MTVLLLDTSVLIKWFHTEGESEVDQTRAVRRAHERGDLDVRALDLAFYELGNVLLRSLRWEAPDVADQLADLQAILGTPLSLSPAAMVLASTLGARHSLTFYDACWAAVAADAGIPLVSADRRLVTSGLAESVTAAASRLRLT